MQLNAEDTNPMKGGPSFSLSNRIMRAVWTMAWILLASWTPPPLHRWRNLLLRTFGAKIHPTAKVYGSARVWYPPHLIMEPYSVIGPRVNCYCQGVISLGEMVVISQGSHLCAGTHDISDRNFQLVTKPITIRKRAWVAADAFVGPGVTIGEGAVLGARAVLFKDADPWGVYVGNPGQKIKVRAFR